MAAVFRPRASFIVLVCFGAALVFAGPKIGEFLQYAPDFCYPYRNTTDVADLDRDGDLDLIVHMVCREEEYTVFGAAKTAKRITEYTMFHGTALWINQGGGRFAVRGIEYPPYLFFSAAAADVDRDGDADVLSLGPESLWLFLNQSGAQGGESGVFKVNNPIMAPERVWQYGSTVLGDLNGDLQPDGFMAGCCGTQLPGAILGEDAPSTSWVWINDWDPRGWLEHHSLPVKELDGLPVRAAALGDLDGDGDLDAFTAIMAPEQGRDTSPADRVLLNDGTGHFADSGQRLGSTDSTAVALGDVDDDHDLDALVGASDGAVLWINQDGAQGGQAGIFVNSGQRIPSTQTTAVFLQDLNGDGRMDALIAEKEQAAVWWNDGRGTLALSDQRFRYTGTHGVAVGDFDRDGRPDIMAADGRDTRVWFNRGDGTFGTQHSTS